MSCIGLGWRILDAGLTTATLNGLAAGLFVFHLQHAAFERAAIETGNGVARLVPFHLDKGEALAFAREQVFHQVQ